MKFTEREQVVEILNRLFYYTDYQQWEALQQQVFSEMVFVDMTSLGAPHREYVTARELCLTWAKGFEGVNAIHHQAGNYIINIELHPRISTK